MRGEVAGRMDTRVDLSGPTRVEDASGGYVTTFAPLTPPTVYADVESLRGQERLQAEALEVGVTHKVLVRYHPQVTAHTRITWEGRVLEVIGPPVEIGRRHLLECWCSERRI